MQLWGTLEGELMAYLVKSQNGGEELLCMNFMQSLSKSY